jgi:hypothetical protein
VSYPAPAPAQLQSFLAAERAQESGGNYSELSHPGGASGAYQFEPTTWAYWVQQVGAGQYANVPAGQAPAAVQDSAAAAMATAYYQKFGNWLDTAESWYYPAAAGTPAAASTVPPGNRLTVAQYGADVVGRMSGAQAPATATTTAYPGGSWDPLNWPGQAAGAATGAVISPLISWVDSYAIRAALFLLGGVAILYGLLHLTDPGAGGSSTGGGSAGAGRSTPKSGRSAPRSAPEAPSHPGRRSGAPGGSEGPAVAGPDISSTTADVVDVV